MTTKRIDTDRFSATLRRRGLDNDARRIAITNFAGSEQENDLTQAPNCDGFGRIRHFRRRTNGGWPDNPLPIDPAARALGLTTGLAELTAQVFQNAICNWRCWYCYVDFPLLSGSGEHSEMLTAEDLFALYEAELNRPVMIDLTGGQPDLVPEWIAWMIEERHCRGLDATVYLWSDDNLSNDYFWTRLGPDDRRAICRAPSYGKVCCFKGFDAASFAFNTAADPALFDRQFELMARLVRETPLDLYAYATFTSPEEAHLDAAMASFVDRLQAIDEMLPLRTVPLQVGEFSPTTARMTPEHHRALDVQKRAIAAWNHEVEARFDDASRSTNICDVQLRRD